MVGGRGGARTRGPLLAKQMVGNTKVLCWCRLRGKSTKFPLSKCPEVVPNVPSRSEEGLDLTREALIHKGRELALEEKKVRGLILEGAVESNNRQPRSLRERRKIGISPILWGSTGGSGQRAKLCLDTTWLVQEVDPLIFEPVVVSFPRLVLTPRLVQTHDRRLAQQPKQSKLGEATEEET